ncbi:unnamed protein product [Schistocephalus solidus]|uniref:Transmembrane emp24 domain-containing protein 7 n=1 Tax=Schistocephalus solidus TaxID=70667 RepID=A0A0X3NTR0_SCHSO|nr:unnamed protein product [Schistocephalus solidus]
MMLSIFFLSSLLTSTLFSSANCFPQRLTFELPDAETFCFYEDLQKAESYELMFQVLSGGLNDVDLVITDPDQIKITEKFKSTHENIKFTAHKSGSFSFCFGNQFSSVSHKVVLFELRSQDSLIEEAGLPSPPPGPQTALQALTERIHEYLSVAEDFQTELRAKKMSDRLFVVDLMDHITLWSAVVSLLIVLTVFAQVTILKGFFKDKKLVYSSRTSTF